MHTNKMRFLKASVFCLAALSLAPKGQSVRLDGQGPYTLSDTAYDSSVLQQQGTVATEAEIKTAEEQCKISLAAFLPDEELGYDATEEQRGAAATKRDEDKKKLCQSYQNIRGVIAWASGESFSEDAGRQIEETMITLVTAVASLGSDKPEELKLEEVKAPIETLRPSSTEWHLSIAQKAVKRFYAELETVLKAENAEIKQYAVRAIQQEISLGDSSTESTALTGQLCNALRKVLENLAEKAKSEDGKSSGGGSATEEQIAEAVEEATKALRGDLQSAQYNETAALQAIDNLKKTVKNNYAGVQLSKDVLRTYSAFQDEKFGQGKPWDDLANITVEGEGSLADADRPLVNGLLTRYLGAVEGVKAALTAVRDRTKEGKALQLHAYESVAVGINNLVAHSQDPCNVALGASGKNFLRGITQIRVKLEAIDAELKKEMLYRSWIPLGWVKDS